jgi:ParB family chromosome partitioning protein
LADFYTDFVTASTGIMKTPAGWDYHEENACRHIFRWPSIEFEGTLDSMATKGTGLEVAKTKTEALELSPPTRTSMKVAPSKSPNQHDVRSIPIASINVGKRLRPLGDIAALVESIRDVGLLSPINITKERWLISGLHRLEAFKALGRKHIPAIILSVNAEEAELRELDENLMRNDLTLLERADHLYRRKSLYEVLHPETCRGGDRGNQHTGGKKRQTGNVTFSQTAATITGQSSTTVQRLIRVARMLTPKTKELLRGTELADNQRALMKLCKLTPEMQERVARKAATGESGETAEAVVEADVNLVATEIIRDLESAARGSKLKEIIQSSNRLNPTIRRDLIRALKNTSKDAADLEAQLSKGFQEFPKNGKAHQRLVREHMATLPEPDLDEKRMLASDLKNAIVREISYSQAKAVILGNEYLGKMNSGTLYSVGLFFRNQKTGREFLGGVECFGSVGGSNVAASICGSEHKDKVLVLVRGACCHWVDREVESRGRVHTGAAASFLISRACDLMADKGFNIICAYSDPVGGLEFGSIYQGTNFLYTGMTSASEQYRTPDGREHDSRQIHGLTRDRRNGGLAYTRTREQQKALLEEQGCSFFKGNAKHRYIYFAGDRRMKRMLRSALRLPVLPYPKRPQDSDGDREGGGGGYGLHGGGDASAEGIGNSM